MPCWRGWWTKQSAAKSSSNSNATWRKIRRRSGATCTTSTCTPNCKFAVRTWPNKRRRRYRRAAVGFSSDSPSRPAAFWPCWPACSSGRLARQPTAFASPTRMAPRNGSALTAEPAPRSKRIPRFRRAPWKRRAPMAGCRFASPMRPRSQWPDAPCSPFPVRAVRTFSGSNAARSPSRRAPAYPNARCWC